MVVHELSSASGDPAACHGAVTARNGAHVRSVTVKLGRVGNAGSWRWLTDAEISGGAIEAIETGRDVVVGDIP